MRSARDGRRGADRPARRRAGRREIGPGRSVLPGACEQERRAVRRQAGRAEADGRGEEQAAECGQHGIADPAMGPGHRPGQDLAPAHRQAAAHHQVGPTLAAPQEPRQLGEVVGAVRVTHEHKPAARCRDAAGEGVAIAAVDDLDHPDTGRPRQGLRAIPLPLSTTTSSPDAARSAPRAPGDAGDEGLGLVEAGHEDGNSASPRAAPPRSPLIHVFPRSLGPDWKRLRRAMGSDAP